MPVEIAIALLVLWAAVWVIYKVLQGTFGFVKGASELVQGAAKQSGVKRFQKKRKRLAQHVHFFLPDTLQQARGHIGTTKEQFEKAKRSSNWMIERPTWDKAIFQPYYRRPQRATSRRLDVADIVAIQSLNPVSWQELEDRILAQACSYPGKFTEPARRAFSEFPLPKLDIVPALFSVELDSISEKDIEKFFGKERASVAKYNKEREGLLARHDELVGSIKKWNQDGREYWKEWEGKSVKASSDEKQKFLLQSKQFEIECHQQRTLFMQIRDGVMQKKRAFVLERVDMILSSLDLPHSVPQLWNADYDESEQILIVEIALPDVVHNPPTKTVLQRVGQVVKPLSQTERKETVPKFQPALMLRVAKEILRNDVSGAVKLLVLNGWVDFTDPQTGRETRAYTASLVVTSQQVEVLNLRQADPVAAFAALKGKSAGKLVDIIPIQPALNLQKDDSRFVDARAVLDALDVTTNLAAMEWQDFEHLIRELFEKEFAERGAEVKITQASRDRGVDAIAFNPDPIQGGKYIIQAKRYTNTVDVSAVRDLCAVVRKEGASRGILVTTSSYGADAYEFANNEPVTLLDGAQLLGLLEKHGYQFRINLAEARHIRQTG